MAEAKALLSESLKERGRISSAYAKDIGRGFPLHVRLGNEDEKSAFESVGKITQVQHKSIQIVKSVVDKVRASNPTQMANSIGAWSRAFLGFKHGNEFGVFQNLRTFKLLVAKKLGEFVGEAGGAGLGLKNRCPKCNKVADAFLRGVGCFPGLSKYSRS
jgi:hypothetical protein